ncbi:MAG TPA: hypothetical protein VJ824_04820 [Bacillota bacterium]|nr:hypothetical protein [Bacillota bacterium]
MGKKKLLKSIFISIITCIVGAAVFSAAIIYTSPKKEENKALIPPAATKADPNAIPPQSIVGSWEMTSPKLGHAQITFEKDGTLKFKSNGMNMLAKYSIQFQEKTIILELTGIVDSTVTLTGEMTSENTIKWREIKGWDLGETTIEWVKK